MKWKTGLVCCLIFILVFTVIDMDNRRPATECFIAKWMTNPNGTLATHLEPKKKMDEDDVQGREALSESLGLWMIYALNKGDHSAFADSYGKLRHLFMKKNGFIYWKLASDGKKEVSADALIDDLRIVNALNEAGEVWKEPVYIETASNISRFLTNHNVRSGLFVDYYDFQFHENADQLTLSYIMPSALKKMRNNGQISLPLYQNMMTLMKKLPMQNGFYPKSYAVKNHSYHYPDTVNLVDQLFIALHQARAGLQQPQFTYFLENEFQRNGKLFGRYDFKTKKPAVSYESPALYGLAVLYALKIGKNHFASLLYHRMHQFQVQNQFNRYYGGYLSTPKSDTHIFDNLLPLLADEAFTNSLPSRRDS